MNKTAKRKSLFRYFETGTYFWKSFKASFFISLAFSVTMASLLLAIFPSIFILFTALVFVFLGTMFSLGWATIDTIFTRWFISYKWKSAFIAGLSRLVTALIGGGVIGTWAAVNSFWDRTGSAIFISAVVFISLYLVTHFVVTYFMVKDYLDETVEKTYSTNNPKPEVPLTGPFRPAEGIMNRLDKKEETTGL